MQAHDKYRIVQEIFNSIYQHNDSANGVKILESGFEEIRAEALHEASERAVEWLVENVPYSFISRALKASYSLKAAILAGEVKK